MPVAGYTLFEAGFALAAADLISVALPADIELGLGAQGCHIDRITEGPCHEV